jgi:hypothetical protein
VTVATLQAALNATIASTNTASYKSSTYLFLNALSGTTPANSNYYYSHITSSVAGLYMESTITLQSYGQTCVSTETSAFTYSTSASGVTTCSNTCIINPAGGKTSCSYLMNISKGLASETMALNTFHF